MKYDYNYKYFVLVTNCFNEGEDCLYFTCNTTEEQINKALKAKGVHFDEIYSIKESELSLYCFDPIYCNEKLESNINLIAATYN